MGTREFYCPLVQGECKDNCVFNNGCGDYPGDSVGCNLQDCIEIIRQWNADSIVSNGIKTINKKLDAIESTIPDNYTYNISSTLDDILIEIQKIKRQLNGE